MYHQAWRMPGIQKQRVKTMLKHMCKPHALSPPPETPWRPTPRGGRKTARTARQILPLVLVSLPLCCWFSDILIDFLARYCAVWLVVCLVGLTMCCLGSQTMDRCKKVESILCCCCFSVIANHQKEWEQSLEILLVPGFRLPTSYHSGSQSRPELTRAESLVQDHGWDRIDSTRSQYYPNNKRSKSSTKFKIPMI